MSIGFDSQRSEAIRAGLVAEAVPATRQRRPWRGLILVLAGALVGSGATTAAFANSLVKDSSPTPGGQDTPGSVVVIGSDASDSSGAGGGSVTVTTDAGSGKLHIDYQWDKRLRELSRQQLVVTEATTLDLSGHPAEASSAWVSIGCRDKGSIEMGNGSDRFSIQVVEADSHDEASSGPAMAMMLTLDEPPKQIRPTEGCVADVTVTYFAKG
ncbi:MAG: hypothetical protein CVT62_12520 [Actinobacteria bacterium HGW-Actinobacteria-2]|nr:MAG: hypothetical protein CVT62_12520 [Actinobacteria bacterium HGW-Actinobacteria-2]